MKNIVIVTKNPDTHFIQRLCEEAQQKVEFFNPWKDLRLPEGDCYLVRTTGIHHSDLDLLMLASLEQKKIINPLKSLRLFRSKLTQYQWLEEKNCPVLPYLNLEGIDLVLVEKFYRLYPEMVVKPHFGQGGWGIESLNWDQFKSWWKKKKGVDEKYLIQPYLKEAMEFRYFFIRSEWEFILERIPVRGIAANFKNQGLAHKAELNGVVLEKLRDLVKESDLYYGAIDLFVENERLYIIDVNSVPGIEQLEAISGENVMAKLMSAKFFCQKI